MSKVKPIPDGYHNVTPYLFVRQAARAIDYYKNVFGAVERGRMAGPDGKIGHAELTIGDSLIMLADEHPQMQGKSPESLGGSSNSLHLYVDDVDAVTDKAVKAGAKLVRPIANQFYGDRMGAIVDPFGQVWSIGTHIEDVSPEEMQKRMTKMASQAAGG